MNNRFALVEKEMKENYFPALKRAGYNGILIPSDKLFLSNISYAKSSGLLVYVYCNYCEIITLKDVSYTTFGIEHNNISLEVSSLRELKRFVKNLPDNILTGIDSIIIKYPDYSGIIWDGSFESDFYKEFSNYIEDYLPVLFEEIENKTSFRSWYYDKCSEFIYKKFIKPAVLWSSRQNINLIFDIGLEKSQYYFLRKNINIMSLIEKGLSLCITHDAEGIVELSVLISKYSDNNFIFTNRHDDRLNGLNLNILGNNNDEFNQDDYKSERILMVRPDRGVAEKRIILDDNFIPFSDQEEVIASFESSFYCDMLYEKGFDFEITNEKYFEKYIKFKDGVLTYKNIVIDQILICNSCLFSKRAVNILNKLSKNNICINNSNLIDVLGMDLLERRLADG